MGFPTKLLSEDEVIVIFREGFVAKSGKEIPLEVINVAFSQSAFERLFGTGDLLIESAGTHGQSRYSDIPTQRRCNRSYTGSGRSG